MTGAHLLEKTAPERYRLHDLIKVYAAERAAAEESDVDRCAATRRMFVWYLHTADLANRTIGPKRRRVPLDPPDPGDGRLRFASYIEAVEWCEAERINLVGAVEQAAATGQYDIAWQLPLSMLAFLNLRKHWTDWIATHLIALAAARQEQTRYGEASVLESLASAYRQLRRFSTALDHAQQAAAIFRAIGDRQGEAFALTNIGSTHRQMGQFDESMVYLQQALDIFRVIGDRTGEGWTLNTLGLLLQDLERTEEGFTHFRRALLVNRQVDRRAEAITLNIIGETYRQIGRINEALAHHQQALAIHREYGDQFGEATTLDKIGSDQRAAGQIKAAQQSWRQALTIFDNLGAPQADEVRAHLETAGNRIHKIHRTRFDDY